MRPGEAGSDVLGPNVKIGSSCRKDPFPEAFCAKILRGLVVGSGEVEKWGEMVAGGLGGVEKRPDVIALSSRATPARGHLQA